MVGWHHRLHGHGFEQTLGDGEGQGSLVCCGPWGHKQSDTTQRLNTSTQSLDVQIPQMGKGVACNALAEFSRLS